MTDSGNTMVVFCMRRGRRMDVGYKLIRVMDNGAINVDERVKEGGMETESPPPLSSIFFSYKQQQQPSTRKSNLKHVFAKKRAGS
jgi:hypothetical protein